MLHYFVTLAFGTRELRPQLSWEKHVSELSVALTETLFDLRWLEGGEKVRYLVWSAAKPFIKPNSEVLLKICA